MISRIHIVIIILFIIAGYQWSQNYEVSYGPGIVAADIPIQFALRSPENFDHLGYQLTAVASFDITARILAKENYYMDKAADLMPSDLALGWGRMSDEAVLEHIHISQSMRFFYWSVKQLPIPRSEIIDSSANMHIIPANNGVAAQLKSLHVGNVVKIQGQLVNVKSDNNWYMNSSLTRFDSGAGACEIIWVENLSVML